MSLQHQLLANLIDGKFHSGEQLASELGVTRAAIWKNIKILQSEYDLDIHAVTGKGYRLSQSIELLDSKLILENLSNDCMQPEVETFLTIDSTNRYLMKKALSAKIKCQTVFAEQQTSGRGRHGRTWVSPFGGNLYFSILYPFQRTPRDITGLSLAVGVAIVEQLERQGVYSAKLKWPNDILVEGRKLCGILLELHGESHGPLAIVVGVGINISMPDSAANEIDQPWIAYQSLTRNPVSRNQLAAEFLSNVLRALQEFEQNGLEPFRERWQQRDCYMNSKVNLQLGDREITGIARGIDQQGALLLETQGQVQRYYSGEIRLRPVR
ncbi:Biotin operon repressor / Biotin--protein ligase [hydrothermal vent metagenome]|uniref:Biotin operon repressor / Biotin--protein ligase n=1 Tax=hydrothermal vent metagenome TaxID=652676 RepID=A0A3B0ZY70_9ZZZZ